jgi:hypothetical protein
MLALLFGSLYFLARSTSLARFTFVGTWCDLSTDFQERCVGSAVRHSPRPRTGERLVHEADCQPLHDKPGPSMNIRFRPLQAATPQIISTRSHCHRQVKSRVKQVGAIVAGCPAGRHHEGFVHGSILERYGASEPPEEILGEPEKASTTITPLSCS